MACDSRPSSPGLLAAAAAGIKALGGVAVDCGLLTTPQLHWQVRRLNQGLPWALKDYFTTLARAYQQLVEGTEALGKVSACFAAVSLANAVVHSFMAAFALLRLGKCVQISSHCACCASG